MSKKLCLMFFAVIIILMLTFSSISASGTLTTTPTNTSTATHTSSIAPDLINKVWGVLESQYSLPPVYQYTHTGYIKLSGETVINSLVYANVLKAYDEAQTNWTLVGYIREDLAKKVYYRPTSGNEGLLYDFNAPVGVPFTVINTQGTPHSIQVRVASIDTVTYNGVIRKRMYLQSKSNNTGNWNSFNYIWLDGIGCLEGILTSSLDFDMAGCVTTKLLHCTENGVTIYHNPNYNLNYYWIDGGHPTVTKPTNLMATAVSNSQINLTWTDNATIETGFVICRKLPSDPSYTQIATVGANVTSYNDTGLSPLTTYYYIVAISTTYGNSDYSNAISVTTL